MDTKQLTSKINLVKARIAQINDSTLYTVAEKLRLTEMAEHELVGYLTQLAGAVKDIDVQYETL